MPIQKREAYEILFENGIVYFWRTVRSCVHFCVVDRVVVVFAHYTRDHMMNIFFSYQKRKQKKKKENRTKTCMFNLSVKKKIKRVYIV